MSGMREGREQSAYARIEELISQEQCVILDGGTATELEGLEIPGYELRDDALWGTWAFSTRLTRSCKCTRGMSMWGATLSPRTRGAFKVP